MHQLEIDYTPGLLDQFPDFKACIRASVYGCGKAFKAVAADIDMSPSELSRKLSDNPNDTVHFPADRLPDLMAATGDLRPVYWLIERFLEDKETKRTRAISDLAKMLPQIHVLLKTAGA